MPPKDPYKYFRIEGRELLDGLQQGLATWEAAPGDRAPLTALLRHAHTLKGAARVVKVPALADDAHHLEEILAPFRDVAATPTAEQFTRLRQLLEAMNVRLAALDRPVAATAPAAASVPAAPSAPSDASTPAAAPATVPVLLDTVRLQVAEVDAALAAVSGTAAELAALRADFRVLDRAGQQARLVLALANRLRPGDVSRELHQRLPAEAEELVTSLERSRQQLGRRADRLGRELQRLHDDIGRLRLIPVDALGSFLERTARDAAQTLGKRVHFELVTRVRRIDTPVFAGLQEALLHAVRNAVAHGLESEAERQIAGKPETGLVRVTLDYARGRLRAACEDDGRGIDAAAVRRAALAKGWAPADSTAPFGLPEAIALLLQGGVSTTATADSISGRGVGLDAVQAAVARLRGMLTLHSIPGQGTTLTCEVPLAVVTLEVLVVDGGGAPALLPLAAVQRVSRVAPAQLRIAGGREELGDGSDVFPYAPLRRLLPPGGTAEPPRRNRLDVVILQEGAQRAALGVERLLGTAEAVVRPLPPLAHAAPVVAGGSFDARGAPRLLLDPTALLEAIGVARPPPPAPTQNLRPILVVDDSLTTRMLEQNILESAGYRVDTATSAEEGLERLREGRHGLLLVDVEMPGMDGFSMVEQVRRDPALRDLPAILVTSRASPEDRRRGAEAGAQDYVIKGEFDQRRLLQRIQELLT